VRWAEMGVERAGKEHAVGGDEVEMNREGGDKG
jgi:hypothetical protein